MAESKINPGVSRTLDVAKVLVTLLVVIGHVSYYNLPDCRFPQQETSRLLAILTDVIYYFHMPAFFAISGGVYYLTQTQLGRYPTMRVLLRKKAVRLLLPFVFFISLVFIPLALCLGISDATTYPEMLVRKNLCLGDLGWLWFLPTLFCIFVIMQTVHRQLLRHRLALLAVLALLSAAYYVMPHQIFGTQTIIPLVCKHLFYFYIGYLLTDYATRRNTPITARATLLFTLIFLALAAVNHTVIQHLPYLPLAFNLLVATSGIVATFALCSYLGNKERLTASATYHTLKRHSFGIYLFHPVFIMVCFYWLADLSASPYLTFVAVTLLSLLSGVACSKAFAHTPYLRSLLGYRKPQPSKSLA